MTGLPSRVICRKQRLNVEQLGTFSQPTACQFGNRSWTAIFIGPSLPKYTTSRTRCAFVNDCLEGSHESTFTSRGERSFVCKACSSAKSSAACSRPKQPPYPVPEAPRDQVLLMSMVLWGQQKRSPTSAMLFLPRHTGIAGTWAVPASAKLSSTFLDDPGYYHAGTVTLNKKGPPTESEKVVACQYGVPNVAVIVDPIAKVGTTTSFGPQAAILPTSSLPGRISVDKSLCQSSAVPAIGQAVTDPMSLLAPAAVPTTNSPYSSQETNNLGNDFYNVVMEISERGEADRAVDHCAGINAVYARAKYGDRLRVPGGSYTDDVVKYYVNRDGVVGVPEYVYAEVTSNDLAKGTETNAVVIDAIRLLGCVPPGTNCRGTLNARICSDAGHIVARQLGGRAGAPPGYGVFAHWNLFPQNPLVNRGNQGEYQHWKQEEANVREHLSRTRGRGTACLNFWFLYDPASTCPTKPYIIQGVYFLCRTGVGCEGRRFRAPNF